MTSSVYEQLDMVEDHNQSTEYEDPLQLRTAEAAVALRLAHSQLAIITSLRDYLIREIFRVCSGCAPRALLSKNPSAFQCQSGATIHLLTY